MFKYVSGNILESSAECLVNTVNCEGFMGKGIAYQFKLRFPENNNDYVKACRSNKLTIGKIHTFKEDEKMIINFPTKDRWREKSKVEYIHEGMKEVIKYISNHGIKSIAIPPLGCGNGGLQWAEIKPLIISFLEPIQDNLDIYIYEPNNFTRTVSIKEPKKPTLSHLVLMLIKLKLKKQTKIRLQKAAYFFNILAHQKYFKFEKHKFGPYSHSIDIVAREIKEMQEFYKLSTQECYEYCKQQLISKSVSEKLIKFVTFVNQSTNFINNIHTTKEVELLATVCFLIEMQSLSEQDIIHAIKNWSDYKAESFSEDNIKEVIKYLYAQKIIDKNLLGDYILI